MSTLFRMKTYAINTQVKRRPQIQMTSLRASRSKWRIKKLDSVSTNRSSRPPSPSWPYLAGRRTLLRRSVANRWLDVEGQVDFSTAMGLRYLHSYPIERGKYSGYRWILFLEFYERLRHLVTHWSSQNTSISHLAAYPIAQCETESLLRNLVGPSFLRVDK